MSYKEINSILLNIREEFHKFGDINDSNAKLEEILKFMIIGYYEAKFNGINLTLNYVEELSLKNYKNKDKIVLTLKNIFEKMINNPMFKTQIGKNIFEEKDNFILSNENGIFAKKILLEVEKIDFLNFFQNPKFDLINELFGHFVRDNFRDNKEDGQYMTPKEVVNPILKMLKSDILNENFENLLSSEDFLVMDPTCGVSTLVIDLVIFLLNHIESLSIKNKDEIINRIKKNSYIVQDKVPRMSFLSKINMLFLDMNINNVFNGNSITGNSEIDKYYGKTDIIITNPPFGASYNMSELDDEQYPICKRIFKKNAKIDSELLMLDKCINLLKPNGKMIIVLPDKIVSSKNLVSFRKEIMKEVSINAIIELPAETFAQAGTRTKTVILYLEKSKSKKKDGIFMSVCENIGFEVKEKSGIPVKIEKGVNELEEISTIYTEKKALEEKSMFKILNDTPSCVLLKADFLINGYLTPNFYNSRRLNASKELFGISQTDFEVKKIEDIVEIETKKRKSFYVEDGYKHISVLHINSDTLIDFKEVFTFKPISKGRLCFEGDILFSKINPRIKRMAVVPKIEENLVCSNEFIILRPKEGINPYFVELILNDELIYNQIISFTSGTSSSHNRIKEEDFRNILIPFPKESSLFKKRMEKISSNMKKSIENKYKEYFIFENANNEFHKLIREAL